MTTLTTTLGWTIDTTEKYIEVEVYAKNIDGTSTAATIATPSTDSISYKYTPQIAPSLTAATTSDTSITVTVPCLSGQNSGWFLNSDTLTYVVSYKTTAQTTWTNASSQTCTYGSTTSFTQVISSLTSVSTYQFAVTVTNDIGTGPTTQVGSYASATTYGTPSTPARPTLTQNTNGTVTVSWSQPSPLNAAAGASVDYNLQILKTDGTTWATLGSTISSTSTSLTQDYSMSDLKTNSTYATDASGAYIKIRLTATTTYGTSTASEANSDSAVYQS